MDRSTTEATSGAVPTSSWPAELQAVYGTSSESFVRLAAVLIGRRAEAEEVVHDAFLSAATRCTEIDNVGAYVRRSVVNGAYGVLRRRRIAEDYRPDPPPVDAPVHLVEFRDVLMGLSWDQRTVIVLRFLEGLSVRQTAQILGYRESTVRSHSRRGLKALRKELSP
jgi:RNA polymerase sigma factor (sigma-70 family)